MTESGIMSDNKKIVDHYGIYKQMTIWVEELSELTKEICKWNRKYEKYEGDIPEEQLNHLKKNYLKLKRN